MTLKDEQQRVYEWLNGELSLPVFADAYKGSVYLLNQKSAGYVTFVAHAGRDLMNILASNVAGVKPGRVNYQEHIDNLQESWLDEWSLTEDLLPEESEKERVIPIQVCQQIAKLIDEHKSGRTRSSEADGLFFSTFLDYPDKEKIPGNFLSEWKSTKNWFLKHAHLREKSFSDGTEDDLVKNFRNLDGYLYIAASSQYERLKGLDEILDATNN